jgi:hypothetical protein
MLIVDGANTDDVLAIVLDALPKDFGRGHILLTTRSAYPSSIFGPPLTMRSFSDEQGALLLFREAGFIPEQAGMEQVSKYDRQMARRIVHELGGLPLAMTSIGRYQSLCACELEILLQVLQEHRGELFQEKQIAEYPEPVASTWNKDFQHIEEQNPVAMDLLRILSFLDQDTIPRAILKKGIDYLGTLSAAIVTDDLMLDELIADVRAFSLLDHFHNDTWIMHRVVKAVIRDKMTNDEQQIWKQRALAISN